MQKTYIFWALVEMKIKQIIEDIRLLEGRKITDLNVQRWSSCWKIKEHI